MKKIVILLLALSLFASNLVAQATVKSVKGQVQVKEEGRGSWKNATVNMTLSNNMVIATGFGSSAKIDTGRAVVEVGPLSNVKLDELGKGGNSETEQSMSLKGGSLSVDVKKSETGASFKVKGPINTASVRGTAFNFDGITLETTEGVVAIQDDFTGAISVVSQGQTLSVKAPVSATAPPEGEAIENETGENSAQSEAKPKVRAAAERPEVELKAVKKAKLPQSVSPVRGKLKANPAGIATPPSVRDKLPPKLKDILKDNIGKGALTVIVELE